MAICVPMMKVFHGELVLFCYYNKFWSNLSSPNSGRVQLCCFWCKPLWMLFPTVNGSIIIFMMAIGSRIFFPVAEWLTCAVSASMWLRVASDNFMAGVFPRAIGSGMFPFGCSLDCVTTARDWFKSVTYCSDWLLCFWQRESLLLIWKVKVRLCWSG